MHLKQGREIKGLRLLVVSETGGSWGVWRCGSAVRWRWPNCLWYHFCRTSYIFHKMTRILVQRGSSGSSSNPSQGCSHAATSAAAAASSSSAGPLFLLPTESIASKVSLSSSFEEEEKNYEDLNEPGIDQETPETNNNADTKSCELDDAPKEVRACETDSLEDGHIAFLLNSLHLTADRTNSAVGTLEQEQISVDLSVITASIDSNVANLGFKPELASVELGVYDTSEKPVIE